MSHIRIGQKVYDVDPVIAGHIVCLDDEVERLKCCGNCDHLWCDCGRHECHESDDNIFDVELSDSCHLPTNCWQSREEATDE